MDLLNRYLQAVRFWLPDPENQDITAELEEDIRSQIEANEAERGRPLNQVEIETILKIWGPPLLVAQRFLPQRYLIGPTLFPVYALVLKLSLLFWVGPWLLIWLAFVVFDPSYRDGNTVFRAIQSLWVAVVAGFAIITLGFALLQRHQASTRFLEKWNPRKLPAVIDPNRIPRCSAISELVWDGILTFWWMDALRLPVSHSATFSLAPVWHSLYWPILVMLASTTALAAVNSIQPWWTRPRAGFRLAIDILGLAIIAILLSAGPLVIVSISNASTEKVHNLSTWINVPVQITALIIAVSFALRGIQDARRLYGMPPFMHRVLRVLTGD